MLILLTGFEAFGPHVKNPTEDMLPKIIEAFGSSSSHQIVSQVLSVCHIKAPTELHQLIDKHQPDMIVSLGVDGKRDKICLETKAVNLLDFKIPDNSGAKIQAQEISKGEATDKIVERDLRKVLDALSKDKYPCMLSDDAGTYICNQVFYHALTWADHKQTEAFFIHVPTDDAMNQETKVQLVKEFILRVTA